MLGGLGGTAAQQVLALLIAAIERTTAPKHVAVWVDRKGLEALVGRLAGAEVQQL